MLKNTFLLFAKQQLRETVFPGGTALTFYRDFEGDKQLNSSLSSYRIGPDIQFVRNSNATFINSLCTIEVAAINTPRFEYSPTGEYKGLLIEEQRTNLVTNSIDFQSGSWAALTSGVTVSAVNDVLAPDGTYTATLLTLTTASGPHVLTWSETQVPLFGEPLSSADFYDRSIFVKKKDARYLVFSVGPEPSAFVGEISAVSFDSISQVFDFELPGFLSESNFITTVHPFPNDWYRITINKDSVNGNTNRLSVGFANGPVLEDNTYFTPDVNSLSGVYIWGAQVEKGQYPTSYIPTNGVTTARASDLVTIPFGKPFTLFYNPSASTLLVRGSRNTDTGLNTYISFTNALGSKYWALQATLSGHSLFSTSASGTIYISPADKNTEYKLVAGIQDYNFVLYQDNTQQAELTSTIIPPKPSTVNQIHFGRTLSDNYLNGHLKEIAYWSTRISNNILSSIEVTI